MYKKTINFFNNLFSYKQIIVPHSERIQQIQKEKFDVDKHNNQEILLYLKNNISDDTFNNGQENVKKLLIKILQKNKN